MRRTVNARRAYDSSRRRERARHAHDALLDAALTRFLDQGFTATTIESIAADAGVSPATIYKTYGGKPGLVRALCERALGGQGRCPPSSDPTRSSGSETDPRKVIEGWGRLTAEVAPRIAPLLLLLPRRGRLVTQRPPPARRPRRQPPAQDAPQRPLPRRRWPPDRGSACADATDVLWTYSSPELFDLLVRRRRWSLAATASSSSTPSPPPCSDTKAPAELAIRRTVVAARQPASEHHGDRNTVAYSSAQASLRQLDVGGARGRRRRHRVLAQLDARQAGRDTWRAHRVLETDRRHRRVEPVPLEHGAARDDAACSPGARCPECSSA